MLVIGKSFILKMLLLFFHTLVGLGTLALLELRGGLSGILVGAGVVILTVVTHAVLEKRLWY